MSVERELRDLDADVVHVGQSNVRDKIAEHNEKQDKVLRAEPDQIRHAVFSPNDPYNNQIWGMAKIQAAGAWDLSTGSQNVVVAVLATGTDAWHLDLRGKLVPGWNVVANTSNTAIEQSADQSYQPAALLVGSPSRSPANSITER